MKSKFYDDDLILSTNTGTIGEPDSLTNLTIKIGIGAILTILLLCLVLFFVLVLT